MSSKQLSTEDQVIHTEIVWYLDIIDFNVSFSAADSDSEEYVAMFPDSTTAKSFQQKAKKVKYVVQFVIALYFKELTLEELVDPPFSFRFDESQKSQMMLTQHTNPIIFLAL